MCIRDRLEAVEADIRGVAEASHRGGAICKVILETGLLDTNEKIRGSIAAKNACADFVKTSTGFSTGGATAEDVQLMRAVVGGDIGVKASGGVRTPVSYTHLDVYKRQDRLRALGHQPKDE